MRYGDGNASLDVEAIPTGALALDAALGIGGVPRGRIIEIYGPESSGKTTARARDPRRGPGAWAASSAFIDAEHALDPGYAARLGVDIDEVLISQPDTGEDALEICDMLVRSGGHRRHRHRLGRRPRPPRRNRGRDRRQLASACRRAS